MNKKLSLLLLLSVGSHVHSAAPTASKLAKLIQRTKLLSVFAAGYYVKTCDTDSVLEKLVSRVTEPITHSLKAFIYDFKESYTAENISKKNQEAEAKPSPLIREVTVKQVTEEDLHNNADNGQQ